MSNEADGEKDDEDVKPNGGGGEPAVAFEGADLVEKHATGKRC